MSALHFIQFLLYNFGLVNLANRLFSRHFGHSCGTGKFILRSKSNSPFAILYPLLQFPHLTTSFKIFSPVSTILSGKESADFEVLYTVSSKSLQLYPSTSASSFVFGKKRMAFDLLYENLLISGGKNSP